VPDLTEVDIVDANGIYKIMEQGNKT